MSQDQPKDFIRAAIAADVAAGRFDGRVQTRFPPEPNGFLHIGHAKALAINFGIAREYGARCNLRFDDTNPVKEETQYVEQIKQDITWLGHRWDGLYFASDYFERLYDMAVTLIRKGLAYVDDLSQEEIREYRGTLTQPGRNSPHRDRSSDENLDLFRRMRAGEFPDGSRTLRAKIDMASGNINMRDPVMYRILHASHHQTGDAWCIYPTYDFAHGQSDSIEGITHSLCSLEYADHRPLYDWFCEALQIHHPQQIEFAKLLFTHTVMSKRKLRRLVDEGHVRGWDDPRMPTLAGVRRRGYTPEAINDLCERVGVSRTQSVVELAFLEHCQRQHLNKVAPRVMAVLRPLRVVITNYAEGQTEQMEAVNNPEDSAAGTRMLPFSRVLYVDRDDFREDPPKKFYRLAPGREVRLRYAYLITCEQVVKDEATGAVVELRCTYDPATRGGNAPDGRKVRSTIHWVSAEHALAAEVRMYDRLFLEEDPDADDDFIANLNPGSLHVIEDALVEPGLAGADAGYRCQFERQGYFCVDPDSRPGRLVFNHTVSLRDEWAKIESRSQE